MECPICNTVIDNTLETSFCPTCHWELVVIPSDASEDMKRYFEGRRDAFHNCYSLIKEKQVRSQELEKLTNDNLELKQKISAAITTLQEKLEILERMKSVSEDLESTGRDISSVQDEIERMNRLATQSQNYQGDLGNLKLAYEKVVHLGCSDQVNKVKAFLRNKGVINN